MDTSSGFHDHPHELRQRKTETEELFPKYPGAEGAVTIENWRIRTDPDLDAKIEEFKSQIRNTWGKTAFEMENLSRSRELTWRPLVGRHRWYNAPPPKDRD